MKTVHYKRSNTRDTVEATKKRTRCKTQKKKKLNGKSLFLSVITLNVNILNSSLRMTGAMDF